MVNPSTVIALIAKYGPVVAEAIVKYGPTVLEGINKYGPKVAAALSEIEKNIKAAKKLGVEVIPNKDDISRTAQNIADEANQVHAQVISVEDVSRRVKAPKLLEGAVSNVGGFFKNASQKVAAPVQEAQIMRSIEAANNETRRQVLGAASFHGSYQEFMNTLSGSDSAIKVGLFDQPGCYVIATYPKLNVGFDTAAYKGVYVGQAMNVGESIADCCSKHGCADVYADIKYKQHVHVFIFSCYYYDLNEKQDALIEVLDADSSYNAVD